MASTRAPASSTQDETPLTSPFSATATHPADCTRPPASRWRRGLAGCSCSGHTPRLSTPLLVRTGAEAARGAVAWLARAGGASRPPGPRASERGLPRRGQAKGRRLQGAAFAHASSRAPTVNSASSRAAVCAGALCVRVGRRRIGRGRAAWLGGRFVGIASRVATAKEPRRPGPGGAAGASPRDASRERGIAGDASRDPTPLGGTRRRFR